MAQTGVSKAEIGLWAVGGLTLLGGLFLRKTDRISRNTFVNAMIVAGGALTTGAVISGRRVVVAKQLSGPLGLVQVDEVRTPGGTLKAWADNEMGVKHRVKLLQGLVAKSVRTPEVRDLALAVTGLNKRRIQVGKETITVKGASCEARDDRCEAKAVFDWVANPHNVRYTGDVGAHALGPGGPVEPVDQFQTALRTVEFHGGDCDDHAVLTSTLAIQNGFAAKFRITSNTGSTWDHIYTMVGFPKNNPKRWVPLDTTLGQGKFGKHPPQAKHLDFDA